MNQPAARVPALAPVLRGWLMNSPWALLAALFGLTVGSGAWLFAGVIVGALLALLLLISGVWWVAMAWIVLSPTFGVFFNDLLQGIPFFRADRILMLVLLGSLAFQVVFQKRRLPAWSPVEWRMAAFLLLGTVHTLVGLRDRTLSDWSKQDAALLFDGYLMPMAGFFIARRLGWDEARAVRFLWLLAAAALFLAITAPLETLLGINWFIPTYIDVIQVLRRATGTFGNAAAYGAVMGSMLLLVALLYTQVRGPEQRILLLSLLLAALGAIVLSKTRASWLGVAAGLAFVFVRDPKSRPLLTLFGIGAAIAATVALPLLLAMQGFEERVLDTAPIYNRIAGWGAAINMMLQNPLTGVGWSRYSFGMHRGEYAIDVGDVTGAWIRELTVPHNEFFNVGAMTGLVGFVLYLRVFTGMFGALRAAWSDAAQAPFTRAMAGYVGAIWLAWCINACFADFGNFDYANIIIYFTAGIVAALADTRPSAPHPPAATTR
jgi:O-antigen ligase